MIIKRYSVKIFSVFVNIQNKCQQQNHTGQTEGQKSSIRSCDAEWKPDDCHRFYIRVFWLEPKHQTGSAAETTESLFIEVYKWTPTQTESAYGPTGNSVFSLNSKCRSVCGWMDPHGEGWEQNKKPTEKFTDKINSSAQTWSQSCNRRFLFLAA